jgi:STE24 endopeptidase
MTRDHRPLQLGGFATHRVAGRSPWFNTAFGLPPGEIAPAFLLFGLLSGLVMFWFSPDRQLFFAQARVRGRCLRPRRDGRRRPLIGALRKLAQKNLSNLTPHPLVQRVLLFAPDARRTRTGA